MAQKLDEKILKAAGGTKTNLTDYSWETTGVRTGWDSLFPVLKTALHIAFHAAQTSFQNECETKTSLNNQNLKE